MKIAFDISQTGTAKAGCGFYAAALIDELLKTVGTHDFMLLTSFGDFFHDPAMALSSACRYRGVSYGPRLKSRNEAESFWRNSKQVASLFADIDVVHANNFWCPPRWGHGDQPRPSLIYTVYDLSFAENPEWTTEANRLGCFNGMFNASLCADWFVAISDATRKCFLHHFPHVDPSRVKLIYPASRFDRDENKIIKKPPAHHLFHTGNPFFLSVGTIEPRKNQRFLVKAYHRYRAAGGLPIPLVLAGGKGWLMEDFDAYLSSSPWSRDIHLLGYVSEAELAWLYTHCLANLYPSNYEGFGLPVLEGMGMGAVTIAANRTSLPEIVGDAGLLLGCSDLEGWAEALSMVSRDQNIVRKLSVAAKERASLFNWATSTDALLSLYEQAS
jgi:glycosyltransferase involved in cell wall biosynthesis